MARAGRIAPSDSARVLIAEATDADAVARLNRVCDIKVDGRETQIRAATVRERMPATELISQRSLTVAALSGSMVYARILAIGGHLGKSPHFYVAHPRAALGLTG